MKEKTTLRSRECKNRQKTLATLQFVGQCGQINNGQFGIASVYRRI